MTRVATRLAETVTRLTGAGPPVRVRAWDGSEAGPSGGPVLVVASRRALRRVLWSPGELGLARAYITGDLDVEGDLDAGLRAVWTWGTRVRQTRGGGRRGAWRGGARAAWRGGVPGAGARWPGARAVAGLVGTAVRLGVVGPRPRPPANEVRVDGRPHARDRDRAVISGHYDLSNAFYRLILDPRMVYSCAVWSASPVETLADAQRAKLDLICRKLGLRPGMRLLDVGCGWGALVVHAAEEYGVRAVGVTLSAEQAAYARTRVEERGLGDRVEIRHTDYRDVADGPYDAAAAVEMGEHVGLAAYPAFARSLHDRVRPGARVLIQQMSHGAAVPDGGAFITTYIAADMHMRPVGDTLNLLEGAGLEIRGVEALREHYVRTIRAWRTTLEARWREAVRLVGEETARTWRLYLTGGALAFEDGRMGVDQIVAVRPGGDARRDGVGVSAEDTESGGVGGAGSVDAPAAG